MHRTITDNVSKIIQEQNVSINRVSTRFYTQNLPKLHVPTLQQTLEKYLVSAKPFVNNDELAETQKKIKEFIKEDSNGQKLQRLLEEKAEKSDNWLADWWVNAAYLAYRDPVVIFSNPGQTFPIVDFLTENDRLNYAANVVLGAVDYKGKIDRYVKISYTSEYKVILNIH